ncbi:protein kinase domain-containing protein [Haematococcus lacustris]|uniref:Protein kinase domain-containing protein n=1 Tax=Haematococcus lacustris TaxID=44745 RepID=A0A699ZAX6_HAELA|nr:protein kinase domain-containing protein [Haematococcus lacustris]
MCGSSNKEPSPSASLLCRCLSAANRALCCSTQMAAHRSRSWQPARCAGSAARAGHAATGRRRMVGIAWASGRTTTTRLAQEQQNGSHKQTASIPNDAGMLPGNATAPKTSSAGTASIPRSLTVDPMSRFVSIEVSACETCSLSLTTSVLSGKAGCTTDMRCARVLAAAISCPLPKLPHTPRPAMHVQTIGTGAFGSVKLVHEVHTKKMLAMKCLKRRNINKYLEAEIVNHSMLRHPHIVQFKEVFLTSEHVMEYANGGSLFDLVRTQKRLKETQARWFIQQLVLSLDYMHRKGIANRDIKLENCLLQNEEGLPYPLLKICDFGYSKADFRSAAKSQAPEVIKSRGHYDAKHADVWSTGVVLYIMLYGKYPFDLDDSVEVAESTRSQMMLQAMEKERYDLSPHVLTSLECTDFLKRLLKPDPAKRLTLQGILQHPWFLKKLPPHAQEMNDYYTALPLPEEHQQPEHIRALLEGGRKETAAALGMPSK